MKSGLLKLLDKYLGRLATMLVPPPSRSCRNSLRSILLIRPGGIGDGALLIPAIKVLRSYCPDARITVLAEKRNHRIFELSRQLDALLLYDRPRDFLAVINGNYDVVIDTEQWYRLSAVVTRLIAPPQSIGFATNERKRLFTHPVAYDTGQYEAASFFRLLEPLGIPVPDDVTAPFLEVPRGAVREAAALLKPLSGRPFAALFPGASVPEKQWGEERFRDLIALLGARGLVTVIFGGADTRPVGARLAGAGDMLDLSGRCSLPVSAAVLARSRLLVSGDSGLLHVAAGLGVPTVALFGPSAPAKWAPRGDGHRYLRAAPDCPPCSRYGTIPRCRQSVRCLANIPAAEVIAAVDALLELSATGSRVVPVKEKAR